MHRIFFISRKKEKARIKFMNFSQNNMGSVFFLGGVTLYMPGRVIRKTQIWYLIPPCLILSIIRYRSRVKWGNPGKRVAPSSTLRWSIYRKGNVRVTVDYGRPTYIYIYIYIYGKTGVNPTIWKYTKNEWKDIVSVEDFIFVWIRFGLVWSVLWHINLCRLFNAKSNFM